MKKIKRTIWLLIATILLTASKCKKDTVKPDNPYGLPNATQTGAGVFACRINGQSAIAKNRLGIIGASLTNDTLYIHG